MPFPATRLRRLRRTERLRAMVRETRLDPAHLIQPYFVVEGEGVAEEIHAMPGVRRYSVDLLVKQAREARQAGVGGVILFGIPAEKDEEGRGAHDPEGVVPRALQALRSELPDLVRIADVCCCEYTSHGHCGVVREGCVDNDQTLPILAQAAVAYARAGADIVAPSDMMDGRVAAIRAALDADGKSETIVMSYAVKHASAFYGPFREAAGSTPAFGDRRSYQMDPANAREAIREAEEDLAEGADILIVKPGLPCLDILTRLREHIDVPLAAYQVSGEYTQIRTAAERGFLDEALVVDESLLALRRAGADLILTYFATAAARRWQGR